MTFWCLINWWKKLRRARSKQSWGWKQCIAMVSPAMMPLLAYSSVMSRVVDEEPRPVAAAQGGQPRARGNQLPLLVSSLCWARYVRRCCCGLRWPRSASCTWLLWSHRRRYSQGSILACLFWHKILVWSIHVDGLAGSSIHTPTMI